MLLLRKVLSSRYFSLRQKLERHAIVGYSSTPEIIHTEQESKKDVKIEKKKKIQQPPFVKNLFLGSYNTDMLVYPECLSRETLSELNKMADRLKIFFASKVNSYQIDKDSKIPEEIISELKEMGLFGIMVPTEYGGLGLTNTEYARLAEIIGQDPSIARTLGAHELLGIKSILLAGNSEQKEKYLPKLASGESIAAFCLTELESGNDAATVKTSARYAEDRKKLVINGNKIWITNGGIADIFIVVVKIPIPERDCNGIGLIIVERNSNGISIESSEESVGLKGCNICSLKFEDTSVPVENLLGTPDNTFKVILDVFSSSMFGIAASTIGFLKELFDKTVDYAIHKNLYEYPMTEYQLIQETICKMAYNIYAIESMTYLTANIFDTVENPDCNIESAILKVFSSEQAVWCVNQFMKIIGGKSYFKSYPYDRFLRDAMAWNIIEGSSDVLRMYIALNGCSYAGSNIAENVRKLRNPLFNPIFAFKKAVKKQKFEFDFIKLYMDLSGHLHPSLKRSSDIMEHGVIKLQHSIELLLTRYGQDVINNQMDLKRISDIIIELYVMTACLGRASRSYCIGLQNADIEVDLAHTYCLDANERITKAFKEISEGYFHTNDENYQNVSSKLIKYKGYVIEDPLKYNW